MTKEEDSFNAYLNSARVRVEIAFGRLKGRWRRLQKAIDMRVSFVPKLVGAACVLHNIVETMEDNYQPQWNTERDRNCLPQPVRIPFEEEFDQLQDTEEEAERIRNALKDYMAENFPMRTSLKWHYK